MVGLLTEAEQVTFDGERAGEGYFSADGRQMVFQSERNSDNPFYQIYLMDLETGRTEQMSTGSGKTTCAWIHPSGEKVLFSSTHLDPLTEIKQKEEFERRKRGEKAPYAWDYDEYYDIFERRLDTGELVRLTDAQGYDAEASWSPDGTQIVFASNREVYGRDLTEEERQTLEKDPSHFMDLYIMNSDGSNVRRLTSTPGYDGGPFFSPDGQRIVWRHFAPGGRVAEVFTMKTDGTDVRQVTRMGVMSWAPFYHPSGDYILFSTNIHGHRNFELYMVDADGTQEPVRVTRSEGFDGLPVFTPGGKSLAWTSTRQTGKSQIFMARWNDVEARRLLQLPLREHDFSDTSEEITTEDLKRHVEFLASPMLEGRMTGTPGERLAAEYVASFFQKIGLAPAGDSGTYFQEFSFPSGVSLGADNSLRIQFAAGSEPIEARLNEDYRPLAFSREGALPAGASVVFAGYGIVAPEDGTSPAYDSYEGVDVGGKWVMVLRYIPEGVSAERRPHLMRYASLRYKAMAARDRGAKGLIVVSGPNSLVKEQLVPLEMDSAAGGTSVYAFSITDVLAERFLQGTGKTLVGLQTELDTGTKANLSLDLRADLTGSVEIVRETRTGLNVLGRLAVPGKDQVVVLGAHMDHLGHGHGSNSRAGEEEKGKLHLGADDNASGVAGLMEVAQKWASDLRAGRPFQKSAIFAAWSGEELGLIGSQHFAQTYAPRSQETDFIHPWVAAYLNMDMIGRLREHLNLQGTDSSPIWKGVIERQSRGLGLSIITQADPYLPTDATSFYLKGVPVLSAFTGSHDEYHTPRDTPDLLNYPGIQKTAQVVERIAADIALSGQTPEYRRVERAGQGRRFRVYLGTIPNYGQGDVRGVELSGVKAGSPAEKGGLRGGDLIVGLDGRAIENIYDYMFALSMLRPGVEVGITVVRGPQTLQLKVTPESRD